MSRSRSMPSDTRQEDYVSPISQIEDYLGEEDWFSERTEEHELWAEVPGHWGNHRLWIVYLEDTGFLQINSYLNLKIPERIQKTVSETITLINEKVWLGHFEIWNEEKVPVYRIVMPLRDSTLSEAQIEDLMTAVLQETERFYPALQWVIWGGKSPEEAVKAAIVDTEGEA